MDKDSEEKGVGAGKDNALALRRGLGGGPSHRRVFSLTSSVVPSLSCSLLPITHTEEMTMFV
jgi:hypothetical protein